MHAHHSHNHHNKITEVFDPEFHYTFDVPTHLVVHYPHARLNITRLVLCRNYRPHEPTSCAMGDGCKFVHADVDASALQPHPIHVNYAYRTLEKCSYARLPAGEMLTVMAPNERPPVDELPSERVLVTRGSLMRKEHNGPLSHCAHYYFNRMCNRGERCNFIHSVTVDPTVTSDFKRAPARSTHAQRPAHTESPVPAHLSTRNAQPHTVATTTATPAPAAPNTFIRLHSPVAHATESDSDGEASCGCECGSGCDCGCDTTHNSAADQLENTTSSTAKPAAAAPVVPKSVAPTNVRKYRFNPYSTERAVVLIRAV